MSRTAARGPLFGWSLEHGIVGCGCWLGSEESFFWGKEIVDWP